MDTKGKRSDELDFEKTFEVIHRNDWVNVND